MNSNRIFYSLILASPVYAILVLIAHALNKHHLSFTYFVSNLFTFSTLFLLIILALPNILLYAASKMTNTYALIITCITLSVIFTISNVLLLSVSGGGLGLPGLVIIQMLPALLMVVIGGIVNIVKREGL